ncbi:MAG: DUF6036 family nucleotidyltransferase [Actinomycetota bacterium]|nr:DUF6036 family nucleotidyltransferase [Actinomycetota bacterium]
MPDFPLDAVHILTYLAQVADRLGAEGPEHTVIVVGGSLLALRDLRDTTMDIDSVRRLDDELMAAVASVATERGLAPRWLNDHAVMFKPATLQDSDCRVELQRGRLLVLGAPLEQVFLMKLYASRAPDFDDMVTLWPHCNFASPQAVIDQYYLAYPHAEEDPYLIDHVTAIATTAR